MVYQVYIAAVVAIGFRVHINEYEGVHVDKYEPIFQNYHQLRVDAHRAKQIGNRMKSSQSNIWIVCSGVLPFH